MRDGKKVSSVDYLQHLWGWVVAEAGPLGKVRWRGGGQAVQYLKLKF